MSNESKSGNMNQQGDSGKNDSNRASGQQSQGTAPQTDKSATQQGGSDHKSGQQSQGGSQKQNDGIKQPGSGNIVNDPKKATEAGNKGAASK